MFCIFDIEIKTINSRVTHAAQALKEKEMTNIEIYQQKAIEKLEKQELNSYESDFVESIKNHSKKELKNLTSKQFNLLRKITEK